MPRTPCHRGWVYTPRLSYRIPSLFGLFSSHSRFALVELPGASLVLRRYKIMSCFRGGQTCGARSEMMRVRLRCMDCAIFLFIGVVLVCVSTARAQGPVQQTAQAPG